MGSEGERKREIVKTKTAIMITADEKQICRRKKLLLDHSSCCCCAGRWCAFLYSIDPLPYIMGIKSTKLKRRMTNKTTVTSSTVRKMTVCYCQHNHFSFRQLFHTSYTRCSKEYCVHLQASIADENERLKCTRIKWIQIVCFFIPKYI